MTLDFGGYRLHSTLRILHCPFVCFWQLCIASSSAAARFVRFPPPHPVPVSAIATAPHSFDDVRKIILHLSLPHIFDATSSALPCVSSFELRPYFRVLSSNARAPYPAAAGAARGHNQPTVTAAI